MSLQLEQVSMEYQKGIYALRDFSIQFTPGIYGLLGPNGAGKSTLQNIITTNQKPTQGRVLWEGKDIFQLGNSYRALLGYMPQQQTMYERFSAERFLWYMAALKGINKKQAGSEIEFLLDKVGLKEFRKQKVRGFSGGMKQRLLIAQALLGNPKILVLDEPTAGLDPKERIHLRNLISQVAEDKIVIIATHVVSDIEFIAKEIVFLQKGQMICKNSPKELLEEVKGKVWNVYLTPEEFKEFEKSGKRIVGVAYGGERICARILSEEEPEENMAESANPNLEDVYLYVTTCNDAGVESPSIVL